MCKTPGADEEWSRPTSHGTQRLAEYRGALMPQLLPDGLAAKDLSEYLGF
jgi:hypothetical protein